MNILEQKWEFFHTTQSLIPSKLCRLYSFGFSIFVLHAVRSFRSNARLLNLNWNTAKSKVYRLSKNQGLLSSFPRLLSQLKLVKPDDNVAVDFSDFHSFQVLMFAKQTRNGRALPVYFEILKYPIEHGSQNTFITQAIAHFVATIGFRPRLVFDRGFACPSIVAYLCRKKHPFILRIKRKKHVVVRKKVFSVHEAEREDFVCRVYERKLRIIISDPPEKGEPWYLVTNDFDSSRREIVQYYYHRFEIEEFFRDAKRLLGLEWVRCQKAGSLSMLLWFVILGLWFLSRLEETKAELQDRNLLQLSRVRYMWEKLEQTVFLATEGQFLAQEYV